jgi:hypothetical protein
MVFTDSVPGVYLQSPDPISTAQLGGIDEFKSIIILGTSTTGTQNALVDIYSLSDYQAKFGVGSPCEPHVRSLFANYPALTTTVTTRPSRVKFFRCFDTGGSPTTTTHLTAGIAAMTALDELPLGIMLCPEAFTVANAPDTTTLYGLLNTLALAKRLLLFADFRATVTTAALVSTAADAYLGPNRGVAAYYGWNLESAVNVPLSVIAAAQALRTFDERGQFVPPAGKFPIVNSAPQPALLNNAGQETVHGKRVNYIRRWNLNGNSADVVFGTRMMSSDETQGCVDINTYISQAITERSVLRGIEVFKTVSDRNVDALELKAELQSRLSQLSAAGAYQLNVTLEQNYQIQKADGSIETLIKGSNVPSGFIVLDPVIRRRQAFIDFVYMPVITSEQVIIRSSRIAV